MKLQRRKRNSCQGVRPSAVRRKAARLNKIVLVVVLLWLVTSALVLFYEPGNTRAVEPGDSRQQLAFLAPASAEAFLSH
jgi:hypothetical protein